MNAGRLARRELRAAVAGGLLGMGVVVGCESSRIEPATETPPAAVAKPAPRPPVSRDSKPAGAKQAENGVRFGLTEAQRRELLAEVVRCQDANQKRAQPDNDGDAVCIGKATKRHHISEDEYYKIVVESREKRWPAPPSD